MKLNNSQSSVKTIARLGLISKGIVYILIGLLAFMAAFELGGQSNNSASKEGAFRFIQKMPAGKFLLGAVALGLLCYAIWRAVQVVTAKDKEHKLSKRLTKQLRYALSGLAHLSLGFYAAKMVLQKETNGGSSNQNMIAQVMEKSYGPLLLIIAGGIIAAVGIYQLWFAFSEKYKKHIATGAIHNQASTVLLRAGKIGYSARGVVWLILAWMLIKAALHHNASEAGNTSEAFRFLEEASYGSYLLGALGFGLACYGAFNFIRARYEKFE